MIDQMYDLVVIGGGPAGATAGIYAARQGVKAVLITEKFGGQMVDKTVAIENYTGFENIAGFDLIYKFETHLRRQKISVEMDEVSEVKKEGGFFSIFTKSGNSFKSKTIIVTVGAKPRKLNVPGEKAFIGRGMSYCVACDGPVFRNKDVAVVGGGNSGFEAAIFLSTYCRKIYILEYGKEPKASAVLVEKAKADQKIEIKTGVQVMEVRGEEFVKSLIYRNLESSQLEEISLSGIFAEIGHEPDASFLGDLAELNEKKEIIIDPRTNMTKTPGLFAAGDVTDSKFKQIIISAGDGAKAALSALNFIKTM